MISLMIKSAIVLAAAAAMASALRRQSAAVRHTVWTAGLLGAMALPLCSLVLPEWQTGIAETVAAWFQPLARTLGFLGQTAVAVWLAGAAVGLLLLLYSAGRLAWVAFRSEPVNDARWERLAEEVRHKLGIRRPVKLLQNRTVPFLGTWGIVVPRVLLPFDAESWSDERIRMVLGHELAHIQRHDWVVQILADAARAIYWFNPIFWVASHRLRQESEHACDDTVVRMGAAGTRYAEELVEMTRALRRERLQSPILAMAQPSHLEQRLIALLNPSHNRLAATPWAVLVVASVAVGLTLPLAAVRSSEDKASVSAPPAPTVPAPVIPEPVRPTVSTPELPPASASTVPPAAASSKNIVRPTPVATPPAVSGATAALREPPPAPPFECRVTSSNYRTKVSSIQKEALGNGPWLINDDRTIWAADQPYVANRVVNTIWIRPASTELAITGRRLDGDAPELRAGPGAPFETGYIAIGLTFPAPGCWEVTATAGENTLTFITKVRE